MVYWGISILLLDGVFRFVVAILGIVYCGNVKRAKLLRGFGVAFLSLYSTGLLIFVAEGAFNPMNLILFGSIIWFLIGTQRNVRAFHKWKNSIPELNFVQRGFLSLEDGDWSKADDFFEQALNTNPTNAPAYIGKLCVELRLNRAADLANYDRPIDSPHYKRALQFADEKYLEILKGFRLQQLKNQKKEAEPQRESGPTT